MANKEGLGLRILGLLVESILIFFGGLALILALNFIFSKEYFLTEGGLVHLGRENLPFMAAYYPVAYLNNLVTKRTKGASRSKKIFAFIFLRFFLALVLALLSISLVQAILGQGILLRPRTIIGLALLSFLARQQVARLRKKST